MGVSVVYGVSVACVVVATYGEAYGVTVACGIAAAYGAAYRGRCNLWGSLWGSL